MDVNTKERIQAKSAELFMRYGIRSVSMDDIALQLGISKKTIYLYFMDKDELVDAVIEDELRSMRQDCQTSFANSKDAIDEIFYTIEQLVEQFKNMSPVVVYDLQKFHFRSYQKFVEHKQKYLLQIIKDNLERGVKEELYRPEISIDILSKFRLESMMIPFNMDVFPPTKYNLVDTTKEIIEHYLFGVATPKGYKLIVKYKEEQLKKAKEHEIVSGKAK